MTRPFVLFLVLLSVPSLAGSVVRLTDLATGPLTADNARFMAQPWSIALHAAGLSVFLLLLPLQLLARGGPRHRMLGRVAIAAGITGALAGVWITLTYPTTPDSPAELYGLRLVIGTALAGFLLQAALAARARDIPTHRAAITRATAIALGSGTAAIIVGLTLALGGDLTPRVNILAQTTGWALNLAVAEYLLARRPRRAGQPA